MQPPGLSRVLPSAQVGRVRWVIAGLAVAAAVVLHVMAASDATGPAWPEDEIGPLANARVIAAVGQPWSLSYLPYYPGWSVLLAPLWWFSDDPGTVYRAAAVLSVLVAIAAIAPLTALAQRVGLDRPLAIAVAAVVTLAPGRTVMSNYVLTENFLVLMVAVTAVVGMRYFDRPTAARAVVLAGAGAYTFFTHGRAVAILIATGIAFLIEFRRNRRAATIGLVALVALSASAYLAYKGIVGQSYSSGGAREAATIEGLTGNALALLRALVGQLWYQQAAWLALSFVGLGALISLAARELRRRDPRGGSWALLAVAGMVALMTLFMASGLEDPSTTSRVDYWFYGRYLEPFLIPLVVVGLAVLVRGIERRHAMVAAGAAIVTSVAFLFLNLPVVDPAKPTAVINVAGLLAWGNAFGNIAQRRVVVATLMATLALLALAVVLRRWPRLVLLPLAAALAYGSVTTETEVMDVVNGAWRVDELGPLVAQVVPEGVPVAFDTLNGGRAEENRAAFWLSPRRVEVFDSSTEEPPSPWVVARNEWPEGEALGAKRVASGAFPDNALWVMPGEEQDELAAKGFLERPEDSPRLRDYDFGILIDDPPSSGDCADDGGCEVTVVVTNEGIDVWSPVGTRADDLGAIRLALWWVVDGKVVDTQFWDFTTSVFPGESVSLTERVVPPAEVQATGHLEFGLVQEGLDGFPGPGEGTVVLEVTAPT